MNIIIPKLFANLFDVMHCLSEKADCLRLCIWWDLMGDWTPLSEPDFAQDLLLQHLKEQVDWSCFTLLLF